MRLINGSQIEKRIISFCKKLILKYYLRWIAICIKLHNWEISGMLSAFAKKRFCAKRGMNVILINNEWKMIL